MICIPIVILPFLYIMSSGNFLPFLYKKRPARSSCSFGLTGTICVPGDRSISHFSIILGGLASGETRISGLLESDDVLKTIKSMNCLGAHFTKKNGEWIIKGVGNGCLLAPESPLDFENSEIGCELTMGLVGVYDFQTFFKGGDLSKKAVERVLTPLIQMGAQVVPAKKNCLEFALHGPKTPNPIVYKSSMVSARMKSVVLLAALNALGATKVIESMKTQNHMEIMLKEFGVDLLVKSDKIRGYSVQIEGRKELSGCGLTIPGDPSFAIFPLAAALLIPGSDVQILNVLINPSRIGLINILQDMGADIAFVNHRIESGENIADIQVRFSNLKGITISEDRMPYMIDEYPILAIISAFAEGRTVIKGMGKLERLSTILEGLSINNVQCEQGENDLVVMGVPGGRGLGSRSGRMVQPKFDHRIAMSFLVMGLASEYSVVVDDCSMDSTICQDFINLMQGLGARIERMD
ncbi:3-phosphoshikimate 1-carboxyvinyltransferase [Candidatus Liberibacter solanacearum]